MKRLACLMLVVLIGTVASAASMSYQAVDGGGLVWDSVGSKWTITPDSVASVKITADVDLTSSMAVTITAFKGSATVGTLNPLIVLLDVSGTQRDGTVNNIWISKVSGAVALGNPVSAGQSLYTFTIGSAGLAVGDVITISTWTGADPWGGAPVYLKFNAANATMTPLSVTVVPEPMTIALLGLGGLFIRRRK